MHGIWILCLQRVRSWLVMADAVTFALLIALCLPPERFAILPERLRVPRRIVVGIVPAFKPSTAPRYLPL
jgi:hypothetical protein